MARGFAIAVAAFLVLGGVAAIAYQAGVAAGMPVPAGAVAPGPYPYYWHPFFGFGFFGFLFPLFFLFLIFGLLRAAFGSFGHHYEGRRRMIEQWHREMHERQGPGMPDR